MTNDYTATILAQRQQRDYQHAAEQHALAHIATERPERARRNWRIRLPLHLFTIEIYRQPQPQPCIEPA